MSERPRRKPTVERPRLPEEPPRRLTKEELIRSAIQQFRPNMNWNGGTLTAWDIEKFVTDKVTGVKVNGVDVISVDLHHKEAKLPPVMQAYIESSRTKVVVAEYFEPELRKHGIYQLSHPLKTLGNYGRSIIGKSKISVDPSWEWDNLHVAKVVADNAKEVGKAVVTVDIANKASFVAAWSTLPFIASSIVIFGADIPLPVGAFWVAALGAQMVAKKGMYNKEQVTQIDKFVLDFEQARRLYLAKGVEQLTKQYQHQEGDEPPQIVVLYPRAHTLRMEDTLLNPRPVANRIKSGIYKTLAPYLNFSVRKWEYHEAGVDEHGREQRAGWVRTSRKRIRM